MPSPARPPEEVDLAILGGGLAGLSLAARLAGNGYRGRVLVLEPRQHYGDDRSWGFWSRDDDPEAALAECSWARWTVGLDGEAATSHAAPGWRYRYVRSARVYADALEAISRSPGIALRTGSRATALEQVDGRLRVDTDDKPVFAAQVVDTRPAAPRQHAASALFQVFAGRELRSTEDRFEPGAVELMTDLRCDVHGIAFTYVLPLSPRRALVELTRFASTPLPRAELERDLDRLIERRGWSDATCDREEFAVLPMGLPAAPALPAGAVRAGVGGGGLRAASGYGFQRIRAWSECCANALLTQGVAIAHPPPPRRQHWMDAVFLEVLRREPERGPALFTRMARGVGDGCFVRFMSDGAGLLDQARLIAALPPMPFLRAAFAGAGAPARSVS